MKVLHLVGAPTSAKNRYDERRTLATVKISRWKKRPIVKATEPAYQAFAEEVQRRIDERITKFPDRAFVYAAPSKEHPHGRAIATAKDPNLLEAIRSDDTLWYEKGQGYDDVVAGYYILPTYSKVEDE